MFQTNVEIPASKIKLSHKTKILALGSCFAENIGIKLTNAGFDIDVNPFGVLFNPISISNSLELLLNEKVFTINDIFMHNHLWQSFSHSSYFSDTTAENCLQKINTRLTHASKLLRHADVLIITLGTSWVYEDIRTSTVVSNCHKLPATTFIRSRLTVEKIVETYVTLINQLVAIRPQLQLIFSVSPVRHWKDGAHDNNLSKSTLLLAIDQLQQQFDNLHYFPAYEIQLDELRDYRFYATDMLHPSELAVQHIWNKFSNTYFDSTTCSIAKEMEQLHKDLSHRPLLPESVEFQHFLHTIEKRKKKIIEKYPFLATKI